MRKENEISPQEKKFRRLILGLSVIIPLAVSLLFQVKIPGIDLGFLPSVYASINGVTAILLVCAVVAIRNGRQALHKKLMTTCIILSALFLLMYVAYHITSDSTAYGGEGVWRNIYFIVLISHIFLSVLVVPLVLFTFMWAYLGRFDRHRKLAKITFPVWLYVAVSGVVVYIMISPYYVH